MRRTASVAERRGWDRLPISIPFFVRGNKTDGEEFLEFATALNLSAGGLLLPPDAISIPAPRFRLKFRSLWSTRHSSHVRFPCCTPPCYAAPPIASISSSDCNSKNLS